METLLRKLMLAFAAATVAAPLVPSPALARGDGEYRGKIWKDDEGRYRCKRPDGTIGLVAGGAAGALIGRGIDTKGERATGTILGAAAGALLGRKIDRSRVRCR